MNWLALYLFCFLSAPANSDIPLWPEAFCPLLHGVAVQLEIMGRDELKSWQSRNFAYDLFYIRCWYHQVKNAPRLQDELWRFPDVDTCAACLKANQACFKCIAWNLSQCDIQMNCQDRRDILRNMKLEVEELQNVWSLMHTAASTNCNLFQRRCALSNLQIYLTEDEWRSGTLPLPYPAWFDGQCIVSPQL